MIVSFQSLVVFSGFNSLHVTENKNSKTKYFIVQLRLIFLEEISTAFVLLESRDKEWLIICRRLDKFETLKLSLESFDKIGTFAAILSGWVTNKSTSR